MEFWLQRAAVTAVWVLTVPAPIASSQGGSSRPGWLGAVRCLCLRSARCPGIRIYWGLGPDPTGAECHMAYTEQPLPTHLLRSQQF